MSSQSSGSMGLSGIADVSTQHQQLCADLNMDKVTASTSWSNYVATKHNYTLEGNQLHWLACSIYVACRKSSVPAIGRVNTFIEGNLVSLTRLLRLCDLTLIQFIDKCRKWANMVGLTTDFRNKINCLERKFAVSSVVFKKFKAIFFDMFENQDAQDPDKMKVAKKGKGITCTTSRLMEFSWTLYLVVKSEFPDISEDLVNSFHLLLACCDMIYANAVSSDRRDILNRRFTGLPEHFFDDDYDPPVEPICIIDELCKNHEGITIDAKSVREYSWKVQIKKLFERGTLKGDSSNFTEMLHADVFDLNYRSVNKSYEQYVLSVGDFDERVMLVDSQVVAENERNNGNSENEPTSEDTMKEEIEKPLSIIHPNTLTPLTGRQYLKNRDSCGNVGSGGGGVGITPMMQAKECSIRLHTMLSSRRVSLSQSLGELGSMNKESVTTIETEIKKKLSEMANVIYRPAGSDKASAENAEHPSGFTKQRLEMAQKLFYKMLDDIAQEEVKMGKPDIGESLRQDLFLRSLFACAVEIVTFSYNSQMKFPWILEVLKLHAYHFYKIIELIVRTENQLSRDMVKHLNVLEERILESMSWELNSPLWKTIDESNMPIPLCEDVCLPHQLSSFNDNESVQQQKASNGGREAATATLVDSKAAIPSAKPKRGGSLGLFFRKFYHLASVRMQDLCEQLKINDKEVRMKIWTCFEYVIVNHVELMKNRHLDQILMCTLYVACKVLEMDLTFQEIMKCYRNQPQAASNVYRDVLLRSLSAASLVNAAGTAEGENGTPPGERGDLIKFYNQVFVKVIQSFALRFLSKSSNRGGETLTLSPLPVSRSKSNSPFRRISDKHPIFIRCLDNADNVCPSPVKPLSYYFNRSPAKDLQAINNMMQINSVKRSLNTDEDEEPPIKRLPTRNVTNKLQDMMEDRKECKF